LRSRERDIVTLALGALVVSASIALWGMAVGALARDGRVVELMLLAVGYGGMQGAVLLNVIVAPADTLRWHLTALPFAMAIAWAGLTRSALKQGAESRPAFRTL
jgi:hypothetical protein